MKSVLSAILIAETIRVSSAEYFIHHIKSWRWNNIMCEACKWDYHPVCGNDAKTYMNACTLKCSMMKDNPGLRLLYKGECNTFRHRERSMYREGCEHCSGLPESIVCGTNDVTFFSVCYFDCYRKEKGDPKLKIIHPGPCLPDDLSVLRSFHDHVQCICNSDTGEGRFLEMSIIGKMLPIRAGRNVYNKCEAKNGFNPLVLSHSQGNLTHSYKGFCEDVNKVAEGNAEKTPSYNPCKCNREEDKVCVRYRTHNLTQLRKNKCYAECERERIVDVGECTPKSGCGDEFDPHCVTTSFRNVCHFECFRAAKDPRLTYESSLYGQRTMKRFTESLRGSAGSHKMKVKT